MVGRRVLSKLTVKSVSNLKRPGRHSDGYGLYLIITPGGTKNYAFLYRREGRSHELGLGSAITTTLAEARQKAADCRSLLAQGLDPLKVRQSSAEACKKRRTFGDCAAKLIAAKRASWRSQKHAEQWMTSLDRPCVLIKERSVAEIDTAAVLEVLQPLWIRTPETALRLRGRIEAVLHYAKAQGWRTGENCARWNGHLENILARRPKLAQSHHAAMPYGEVPQFMQELRGREAFASTALQFLILTTTRLSEVTGATWAEMDLEAAVVDDPCRADEVRSRTPRPFILGCYSDPQTRGGIAHGISACVSGPSRGRPLSGEAFRTLVPNITLHGFRSSFRDWCAEATNFPREICEQALGHTIGNAAELAYKRTDWLEKRRGLMEQWADFLSGPSKPSTLYNGVRI